MHAEGIWITMIMYLEDPTDNPDEHLAGIEDAMAAIRRSQRRRTLARLARDASPDGPMSDTAVFEVLDAVEAAERAGEAATVSTVAAALDVAQPRASKLVAAAVTAGLLRREADQTDGRRVLLVRTDAGRAVSEQVHRARRGTFAAAMADWSDRDRAEFARLLTRFVAGFGAATTPRGTTSTTSTTPSMTTSRTPPRR
jgi:DNA-binding MarR family transcriptional regulator